MSPISDPVDDVEGILATLISHANMSEFARRQQGLPGSGFPYPPGTKRFWIKYSYNGDLMRHEAAMQSFLHERLIDFPALRIPKVYRVHVSIGSGIISLIRQNKLIPISEETPDKTDGADFTPYDLIPWTFMVMEYVEATPVKAIVTHEPNGVDEHDLQETIAARIAGALLSIISSHVTHYRGPGKTQGFARRLLERSALRVLRGRL